MAHMEWQCKWCGYILINDDSRLSVKCPGCGHNSWNGTTDEIPMRHIGAEEEDDE